MQSQTYEHVIVGSGFVGTEIALFLQRSHLDFLILEPSLHGQSAFSYNSTDGVFDPNLAQRTIGLGGGANVWGNGLYFPTVKNFFGDNSQFNWHRLSTKFTANDLENLLSRHPRKAFGYQKRVLKIFNRLFNGDNYLIEKHAYAGGVFGSSGWKDRSIMLIKNGARECKILSVKYDPLSQFWKLTTEDNDKVQTIIFTKRVIFAAGTLMNAFLVHLATGKDRFTVGSHFSAVVGEVRLNRPQKIENFLQTWNKKEKEFATVSLLNEFRLTHSIPHSAIRFHPISETQLKARWKEVQRRPSVLLFISFLHEVAYNLFTRKSFYDQFQIHLLVDVPLSLENFIEFDSSEHRTARVNLQHTNSSIRGARILLEKIFKSMTESKTLESVKIQCVLDGNFDEAKYRAMDWLDTAHYFGTVPMSDNNQQGTVNEFFELNGSEGIFVLGNSSFPTGSHSHPTLLTVLLAKIFCRDTLMVA